MWVTALNIFSWYAFFETVEFISEFLSATFSHTYRQFTDEKYTVRWNITWVSLLHAIIIVPVAMMVVSDPNLIQNPLWGSSEIGDLMVQIAAGYFVWDIMVCRQHYHVFGTLFWVHALMAFTSCLSAAIPFCQYYLAIFILYETSTIYLNIYTIMKTIGDTEKWWYTWNQFMFAISYIGIRLLWGPIKTHELIQTIGQNQSDMLWFFQLLGYYNMTMAILSVTLNYVWVYQIVRYAMRKPRKIDL